MIELKTYSIQNDINLKVVNFEKLHNEIKDSGFIHNFSGISSQEDDITLIGEYFINESSVDSLIFNHTVQSIDELKNKRYEEIDLKTSELISGGFLFGGHKFSMSLTAQINWSNFPNLPEQLFPINVVDMNEEIYSLSLANKLNFYFTALNHKNQFLQSGGMLKAQVRACVTIEQINLIIDER